MPQASEVLEQEAAAHALASFSQADIDTTIAYLSKVEAHELALLPDSAAGLGQAPPTAPPREVRLSAQAAAQQRQQQEQVQEERHGARTGVGGNWWQRCARWLGLSSGGIPGSRGSSGVGQWLQHRSPWGSWNQTANAAPLLPRKLAWLLYKQEERGYNAAPAFDADKAATLAAYTAVSYCNESEIQQWSCARCKKAGPMTVYMTVVDEVWDLTAYAGYSSKLGAKLVVFRGTDSHSLYNWVQNMHYWRTDLSVPFPNATGALVHTGFVSSYNSSSLRGNITEAMRSLQRWHPWAPVYIIGHSMGGALATVCALDLKYYFGLHDVRVYTFGSPRVGNDAFVNYFDWQVQESFRTTHNRDIVPSVPLQIMGFRHVPREVWQVDFAGHEALTICSDSGEDPTCHDSMCYLGLCTSIADHLVYLGAHMYHSDSC